MARLRIGKAAFKLATTFDAREPRFVATLNVKQYQTENKTIAKAAPYTPICRIVLFALVIAHCAQIA